MKKYLIALLVTAFAAVGIFGAMKANAQRGVDNSPDCDTVAIIKCGSFSQAELRREVNKGDVKRVFNAVGVPTNQLDGMVDGVVWRDGRVTVNGKTVATNAMTAGRWFNPTNDMKRIPNTDRAYKMSTRHFVTNGQTAFVKMVNGEFKFAVIKSCGNPVVAHPKPKPEFKCDALKLDKISRTEYRFNATATAKGGAEVQKYIFEFGDGRQETVRTNKKTATVRHDYNKTGNFTFTPKVTVFVKVNGQVKEVSGENCRKRIEVSKKPEQPPKPVVSCDALKQTKINRTTFKYNATATAKNAQVTKYTFNFGDGKSKTVNTSSKAATAQHRYEKAGTYTTRVTVTFKVNGRTVEKSGANCVVKVTVQPPKEQPKPEFSCDALSAQLISERTYGYNLAYTAEGGATLTDATFDFGDGQTQTYTPQQLEDVTHTYANDGEFTTVATLRFNVGETERTATCETVIKVSPKVCPTNPSLPKDSPECDFPEEVLPEEDEKGLPEEVAVTGPVEVITAVAGATSLTGATYYWVRSRRLLG